MKPRRDNIWTEHELGLLVEGFHAGKKIPQLADELHKTEGGIRWKLRSLKLIEEGNDDPRPHQDNQATLAKGYDLKFKLAVLAARKNGTESVKLGVIKSSSARYIPTVRGSSVCPKGQSVAAQMVEYGGKGGQSW